MKPSSGREDYLKIIFEFNGYDSYVSNKRIAQELNVSAPSVSDMLHKLEKEGMVDYVAYKGAMLTKKGRDIAIDVLRKHRLSESFLYSVLGYSLEEVDRDAELLEHIESDKFFDRLEQFLDYPANCPHGGIIPNTTHYRETQNKTLLDYEEHASVVIKRITDNQNVIHHLHESNLNIGDEITIDKFDQINGIIFFRKGNEQKYINFNLALMIFVEAHEKSTIQGGQ
ncbi:hypothetical protein AOC36_07265 [Erysipelothrix larvae]|uniref:Manganese transport regulator n=1 Tax=Erysipelothrix larvae TaxID=1514105 RepID=A0A0X8H0G0_9FIRM|nr:metal-dependent transcriptional regulator [Erysipelothrix larvae]AMC93788.1 hypothetical protein AOC36_07265 [Erysipelothrix larvae]